MAMSGYSDVCIMSAVTCTGNPPSDPGLAAVHDGDRRCLPPMSLVRIFMAKYDVRTCDEFTTKPGLDASIEACVAEFGGLDILVTNAGNFPPSRTIEQTDDGIWSQVLDLNLTSHQKTLRAATPFLKLGLDPTVIVVGSKNVPAPGPGVSAYSAAKAGVTQLARVAALELARDGVRVNVIHPDKVFDTNLWDEDKISARAAHYGLTVDEYKRLNLLQVEVRASQVGALAAAMAGPLFASTTGAQIPIDGGNDRVI